MQKTIRKSRLPMVDMGNNAEISNLRCFHYLPSGGAVAIPAEIPCPFSARRPPEYPREDTGV
jgi:hypothetical protein